MLRCLMPEDTQGHPGTPEDTSAAAPAGGASQHSRRRDLLNFGRSSTLSCSSMLSRMVYLVFLLTLVRLRLDTDRETGRREGQEVRTEGKALVASGRRRGGRGYLLAGPASCSPAAADEGPAEDEDREDEQEAAEDQVEEAPLWKRTSNPQPLLTQLSAHFLSYRSCSRRRQGNGAAGSPSRRGRTGTLC